MDDGHDHIVDEALLDFTDDHVADTDACVEVGTLTMIEKILDSWKVSSVEAIQVEMRVFMPRVGREADVDMLQRVEGSLLVGHGSE